MNKKYQVNPDLKTILDDGKKSAFSLTDLFDSKNFVVEEEQQQLQDQNVESKEDRYDDWKTKKRSYDHDESEFTSSSVHKKDSHEDEPLNHELNNSIDPDNSKLTEEYSEPKIERFFFVENDVRFDKLNFFEPSRVERHIQEWEKKKLQLIQALTRRRKTMRKKDSQKKNLDDKPSYTSKNKKIKRK